MALKLILLGLVFTASTSGFIKSDLDGKPFGYGDAIPIHEVEGFLPVKDFFNNYARKNVPVVMRGANKVWPGFSRWQSDDYFRSVAPEEPYIISMDKKRGNPDQPHTYIDFKQFLDKYNTSNRRMIEFTPDFIKDDVLIPASLDCESITQGEVLMGNKMWFGANYTTSVVHKDAADNINCLVYGVKNYTIVNPKYDQYVLLDRPDGLYSTMDVDSVDLDKYPGLENVVFQTSELHSGDCIFVPYKWVHQVRSYGRNIAVNIWWNYWKNKEFDLDSCPDKHDNVSTLNGAKFHGWGDFETRDEGVKEHLIDLVFMLRDEISLTQFAKLFTVGVDAEDDQLEMVEDDILDALTDAFDAADSNQNELINADEIKSLPEDKMEVVITKVKYVFHTTRVRALADQEKNKKNEKKKREKEKKKLEKQRKPKKGPDGEMEMDEKHVEL